MTESGLLSADGPLSLTQAVPGNLRTGPCGPVRPPYSTAGRSMDGPEEHAIHIPGEGKGLKPYVRHQSMPTHAMPMPCPHHAQIHVVVNALSLP